MAFLPVTDLAHLIRSKQVSSIELTDIYLERLKRHGPTLKSGRGSGGAEVAHQRIDLRQASRVSNALSDLLHAAELHSG